MRDLVVCGDWQGRRDDMDGREGRGDDGWKGG